MRRKLLAAVLAFTALLTASVAPALGYSSSGFLLNGHCNTTWSISSAYMGTNTAKIMWNKSLADPFTQCGYIEVEMKYLNSTSDMYVKTARNRVQITDPYNQNYTAKVTLNGVYCLQVRFWDVIAVGAGATTGWLTC